MQLVVIAYAMLGILKFHKIASIVIIVGEISIFINFYISSSTLGDFYSCSASNDASKCTKCRSINMMRIFVGDIEGYCKC